MNVIEPLITLSGALLPDIAKLKVCVNAPEKLCGGQYVFVAGADSSFSAAK